MLVDVESQLTLDTMTQFINNQDNLAVLTQMDHKICQSLNLYSVSMLKNTIPNTSNQVYSGNTAN